MILKVKRRTKKEKEGCLVKWIVDEQEYSKSTRGRIWTNLGNSEVDGHLLAKRMIEDFEVGEEKASMEFLELSSSATAGKVELGL